MLERRRGMWENALWGSAAPQAGAEGAPAADSADMPEAAGRLRAEGVSLSGLRPLPGTGVLFRESGPRRPAFSARLQAFCTRLRELARWMDEHEDG